MTTTYGLNFDFAGPRSRGARIARIDALATLLDTALVIPGTTVRFGLDALIGISRRRRHHHHGVVAVHRARGIPRRAEPRHRAHARQRRARRRLGAVPLAGDAFDVLWRANRRNMRLLREWLERDKERF